MVNSTTKTERVFVSGICCSLLGLCARKILVHFQVIKGDIFLSCLALFTVIWFIFVPARIYHLNKRYPKNKNGDTEDKYCVIGCIISIILAIVLHILPE